MQTNKQSDRQIPGRQAVSQSGRQTDKQTNRQTDTRQTGSQTVSQSVSQSVRQTDSKTTDKHMHLRNLLAFLTNFLQVPPCPKESLDPPKHAERHFRLADSPFWGSTLPPIHMERDVAGVLAWTISLLKGPGPYRASDSR